MHAATQSVFPYIPIEGITLPAAQGSSLCWLEQIELNCISFLFFSIHLLSPALSFLYSLPIPFTPPLSLAFSPCPPLPPLIPRTLTSLPTPPSLSLSSSFPLSSSQWFSPLSCHQLVGPGLLRLGRLWLRSPSHAALAPGLWMSGFGLLRGDHLFLCPAAGPGPPAPEDMVHLRRLQEISEQGWGEEWRVAVRGGVVDLHVFGVPMGDSRNSGFRQKLYSQIAQI